MVLIAQRVCDKIIWLFNRRYDYRFVSKQLIKKKIIMFINLNNERLNNADARVYEILYDFEQMGE